MGNPKLPGIVAFIRLLGQILGLLGLPKNATQVQRTHPLCTNENIPLHGFGGNSVASGSVVDLRHLSKARKLSRGV